MTFRFALMGPNGTDTRKDRRMAATGNMAHLYGRPCNNNVIRANSLQIQQLEMNDVVNNNNNNNSTNNCPRRYLQCCHHDHKVIAKVHSVLLVNVEQRQAAADPQTKPSDLGCESTCSLLSSATTIVIMDARSAMRPCYILPMFILFYIFWPP